jgi:hypothetical protein
MALSTRRQVSELGPLDELVPGRKDENFGRRKPVSAHQDVSGLVDRDPGGLRQLRMRHHLRHPGVNVTIWRIFSPKQVGQKLAFGVRYTKITKNWIITLFFCNRNANFFALNKQKSPKTVIWKHLPNLINA